MDKEPKPDIFRKTIEESEHLSTLADVDEVIKDLSRLLKKMVKSRWVAVYLLDRERRDFAPARSCGLPARFIHLFRDLPLDPARLPLVKDMLRKKRHLLIPDAGTSELITPAIRKLLRGLTLLAVPMVARNQVTGAVFVARGRTLPPFSDDEISVIRDMVAHAALVASHIRLFDESLDMAVDMAKRIDVILTLDEINKAISSSLSHERIIETAMKSIERIIHCELVAIVGKSGGDLTVTAARGDAFPAIRPGLRLVGPSFAGRAFEKGETVYVPSLAGARRLGPIDRELRKTGVESLLAIPLVSKETIKGVLLLGDNQPGQFVREDAFAIEKIASQLAVALENARLYEELQNLFIGTVASLANAIDAKSSWTKGHSERVMYLAATLAREMGLPDAVVERVKYGGLLHDIGKIGIIEALLEKPAMLDDDEFPPMRLHPEKGVAILSPIEQMHDVLPGILSHHERYDGTGYPRRLKGEDIPLEARIISVADAFDAMISDRPYRKGLSPDKAIAELERCAGSQFDPRVTACLISYLQARREKSMDRSSHG
jgi:HD-GYP domain-containing protein (c-di-GMP phosphodiesterase class II)